MSPLCLLSRDSIFCSKLWFYRKYRKVVTSIIFNKPLVFIGQQLKFFVFVQSSVFKRKYRNIAIWLKQTEDLTMAIAIPTHDIP